MSKLIIVIISILSFGFLQCDRPADMENNCPNAEFYTMANFSNLDGCSWMLIKGDQRYDVINLHDYFETFGEDVAANVELVERPDMMGICQAGIISEIICKQ